MFELALPLRGAVRLVVYDLAGRRVATPVEGVLEAGVRRIKWNGRGDQGTRLGPAIYFAKLTTPAGSRTLKLLLLGR